MKLNITLEELDNFKEELEEIGFDVYASRKINAYVLLAHDLYTFYKKDIYKDLSDQSMKLFLEIIQKNEEKIKKSVKECKIAKIEISSKVG